MKLEFRRRSPSDISAYEARPEAVRHRAKSELGRLFFGHSGRPMHKWVDYLDLYDRHFAPFRGQPIVFLEIGVDRGGSLDLWRRYFGPEATICGIDINPSCTKAVTAPNIVRIGSQSDPVFLRSVIAEIGQPHIILDDGSHIATHQRVSFETLFPLLCDGGIYAIEDMHTAYWPEYEGGRRRPGTAVDLVNHLVDSLNGWWHPDPTLADKSSILGVHNYESISFIDKGHKERPANMHVGTL